MMTSDIFGVLIKEQELALLFSFLACLNLHLQNPPKAPWSESY